MLGDDFAAHSFLMIMLVISYSLSNCELDWRSFASPMSVRTGKVSAARNRKSQIPTKEFCKQFPIFLKAELAF